MAHDVFISYSSKDKVVADAVCARLEAHGVRCWIAPRDVLPGSNYGASIIDAIHGSQLMVLVLSASANASNHIPKEVERAVSRGLTILPFRIEEVTPGKALDLFIGSVHWLDALSKPLEAHLDRLAETVLKLLPERPAVVPAPVSLPVQTPTLRPDPAPIPPPLPHPLPDPRPWWTQPGVLIAGVAALAIVGWLATRAGNGGANVAPPAGEGQFAPAPAPAPPGDAAPAPPETVPRNVATDIVGCWRWSNNVTVPIRADGSMTAGPFQGQWRRGGDRAFTFTWPEPVDTLMMSADGLRLQGSNNYGVPVVATRVSGGPDFAGVWQWGGVATVVADGSGRVSLGPLSGTWSLADRGQRIYRVTWPKIQDSVTVSEDGSRIQGVNQYGVAVGGTRLASSC